MRVIECGPWALHEPGTDVARLYRAVMLAPTVHVCEALLRGEHVPVSDLDPESVRRLSGR